MLSYALAGLRNPEGFFRWLQTQRPRTAASFGVLVVEAILSTGLGAALVLWGNLPQAWQARALLRDANIPAEAFALAVLVAAPVSALLWWGILWLPIRLGAGRCERLWEVIAWSQFPQIVVILFQAVLLLASAAPPVVTSGLSLLGVGWSSWFVYQGVRQVSAGRATAAAWVHGLVWGGPALFGMLYPAGTFQTGTFV